MKNIRVNNVEKSISSLVMGTDYFTPEIMDKVTEVLDNFIEIGGNTIDTHISMLVEKVKKQSESGWKKITVAMT